MVAADAASERECASQIFSGLPPGLLAPQWLACRKARLLKASLINFLGEHHVAFELRFITRG
jgi:hypothetical protein